MSIYMFHGSNFASDSVAHDYKNQVDINFSCSAHKNLRSLTGMHRKLQIRSLEPLPARFEVDLLPGHQSLLQPAANLHRLYRIVNRHGQWRVVEAGRSKVVGFLHESHLEPPIVVCRDFSCDALPAVHLYQIVLWVKIDAELAFCADNFGNVFLSVCLSSSQ